MKNLTLAILLLLITAGGGYVATSERSSKILAYNAGALVGAIAVVIGQIWAKKE